jgi:hypothetical protein
MKMRASLAVVCGFSILILGMALCVGIRPAAVFDNNWPFSAYGTFRATIAPYAVGILSAIGSLLYAARRIKGQAKWLADQLNAMAVLIFGLLIFPFVPNSLLAYIHSMLAALLGAMGVLIGYMIMKRQKDYVYKILLGLQGLGLGVLLLSTGQDSLLRLAPVGELVAGLSIFMTLIKFISQLEAGRKL